MDDPPPPPPVAPNLAGKDMGTPDRCIYCGSREPPLTKEHVVPEGLGGNFILYKATCERHRKMTAAFEGKCLQGLFSLPRYKLGTQSKRPKNRPKVVPIRFDMGDGVQRGEVPVMEHPLNMMFPLFEEPAFITGRPLTNRLRIGFMASVDTSMTWVNRLGYSARTQPYKFMTDYDIPAFIRMLAKMAHGLAVCRYGLDGFEPFLIPVIEWEADWRPLIGSNDVRLPPTTTNHLMYPYHAWHRGQWLVLCDMRIFSSLGGPRYRAVVGRLRTGEAQDVPGGADDGGS